MTSQPIGSPDWVKPLPGGAQTLLNTSFNWQTLGHQYASPIMDVTAFSGLYMTLSGFTGLADYTVIDVQFRDPSGVTLITSYEAVVHGQGNIFVNVPVLGAKAQLVVTPPGFHNITSSFIVIGHGGGPSSSVRNPFPRLAALSPPALAAGATTQVDAFTTSEGPAHLVLATTTAKGLAEVVVFDGNSNAQLLAEFNLPAQSFDVRQFWLPPQPARLIVQNTDVGAAFFNAGLWLGRT